MDWYKIPEISDQIKTIKEMESSGDEMIRRGATILQFEEGRELTLQIKVTDKYLFQLIASSMYQKSDNEQRIQIPGAEISEIGWDNNKNVIKNWLSEQLRKLEES